MTCPACIAGRCSLHVLRECEVCPRPVRWDDAQVSHCQQFWHTACFNEERRMVAINGRNHQGV